jgi:hypothetical protein
MPDARRQSGRNPSPRARPTVQHQPQMRLGRKTSPLASRSAGRARTLAHSRRRETQGRNLSPFQGEPEDTTDITYSRQLGPPDFDARLVLDLPRRSRSTTRFRSRNARLTAVRRPLLVPEGSDNYEKASHGAVKVFLGGWPACVQDRRLLRGNEKASWQ